MNSVQEYWKAYHGVVIPEVPEGSCVYEASKATFMAGFFSFYDMCNTGQMDTACNEAEHFAIDLGKGASE